MNDATSQALLSAIRTILVMMGTALAAHGYIDNGSVNEIVGAVMVIIPAVWGVWDKYRAEKATQARETVAVQAGVTAAAVASRPGPSMSVSNIDHPQAQRIIQAFAPTL